MLVMPLGIVGLEVNACVIDYALTLRLATNTAGRYDIAGNLRIEAAFTFTAAGITVQCHPGSDPVGLGPALSLFRQTITEATVAPNGALRLAFGNRATLDVPPDSDYEAWTLAMSNGALVVCGPEGIVSTFPAQEP